MYYTVHKIPDEKRANFREESSRVCWINKYICSCGLPTGSVVDAIPDIPLRGGEGPNRENGEKG